MSLSLSDRYRLLYYLDKSDSRLEDFLLYHGFSSQLVYTIQSDPLLRQRLVKILQQQIDYNQVLLTATQAGNLELVEICLPYADYFVRAMDAAVRQERHDLIKAIRKRIESFPGYRV